jgi:hypothetical protein
MYPSNQSLFVDKEQKNSWKDHKKYVPLSKKIENSTLSFAKQQTWYLKIFDRSHLNRILIKNKCMAFV